MTRTIIASLAALGAAYAMPASAQDIEQRGQQAEISDQIAAAFNVELVELSAMDCADDDVACISEELVERYRVDQWARGEAMSGALCSHYGEAMMMDCFGMAMGATVFRVDLPNTARLKEIIALHGWPQPPLFSEEAQNAAWYLAQHAMIVGEDGSANWDVAFAQSVLPHVREAVAADQLTPWHYAAMYDRIERSSGRPQRYATQIMCVGGAADFGELEDADRVTELRAEIGMDAFDPTAYDAYCAESLIQRVDDEA